MPGGTPATKILVAHKIEHTVHSYEIGTASAGHGYGEVAAAALGVDPATVYKTLITSVDRRLVCAVVPVSARLNLKALAIAAGGKSAEMADPQQAQRATGYVVGGISPLGQRCSLPVFVDESALMLEQMYVSAGKRGLQVKIAPRDLIAVLDAITAPIATA